MIIASLLAYSFPADAGRVRITEVSVSSEYTKSEQYPARNVKDSKSSTAWVEGDTGSGVGSWIEVKFDGEHQVTMVKMWAGDWSSRKGWERANRPSELEVKWADGETETWKLADEWAPQVFLPAKPKTTDTIRFRVKGIHSGTAFPDTAIAELQVFENGNSDGIAPISGASASSVFESDSDGTYDATNMLDGIRDTYWCENDKDGDGTGEWVEITLAGSQKISTMFVLNGMGVTTEIHKKGNVAKTAKLEFSDGSTQDVSLKPFFFPQKVVLKPVQTGSVKITFTGVQRGSDYNDLCISEVHFLP